MRAGVSAYQQALVNAKRSGINAETLKSAARTGGLTIEEAHKILGTQPGASREEVLKKYRHMWKVNQDAGSFYLQSKVFRAMERIDMEEGIQTPDPRVGEGENAEGGGDSQDKGGGGGDGKAG